MAKILERIITLEKGIIYEQMSREKERNKGPHVSHYSNAEIPSLLYINIYILQKKNRKTTKTNNKKEPINYFVRYYLIGSLVFGCYKNNKININIYKIGKLGLEHEIPGELPCGRVGVVSRFMLMDCS